QPLQPDEVFRLAEFFKVFGDQTRLCILKSLCERPMTVQEITACVGVSQSAVSHQMGILRRSSVVRTVREGRYVTYALDDDHIEMILMAGIEHIREGNE
ncbi:MAG: ArsR/SmtB family transcription factor, partial [Spirochaetota bacterium]